jgi:hypothetical protein
MKFYWEIGKKLRENLRIMFLQPILFVNILSSFYTYSRNSNLLESAIHCLSLPKTNDDGIGICSIICNINSSVLDALANSLDLSSALSDISVPSLGNNILLVKRVFFLSTISAFLFILLVS